MSRKPISAKVRFAILERDGYACQCCGAKAPNVTLHVDHILPVSKGGGNEPSNLRAICVTCNLGKSDEVATVTPLRPAARREPVQQYPVVAATNEVVCRGEPLSEPIYWIGRQWAVTEYGVECRDGTYVIEKERLWEDMPQWSWERQLCEKTWVDANDACAALAWARRHFAHLKPAISKGAR